MTANIIPFNKPETPKQRMIKTICMWMYAQGPLAGFTCDEVEIALGLSHQSCSARFADMKADRIIVPTGYKKPTRSGRYAAIFRLSDAEKARIGRTPADSPEAEAIRQMESERYDLIDKELGIVWTP